MKHPDEGMVHAWLDGALDDAEANELEAHVTSCTECAAMVAEARGLIAASSRIVSQLDGVPARVVPATPAPVDAAKRAPRAWWRSSGLAAAALLCITTATWIAVRKPASVRDAVAPASVAPANVASASVASANAARDAASRLADTASAPVAATSARADAQRQAAAPLRDATAATQSKRKTGTSRFAVKSAEEKIGTSSEPKFVRQLDAARAQFDGVAAVGGVASAPPPAASAARISANDSSTQKLAARLRAPTAQLQSAVAAAADARAESTPSSPAAPLTSAPLAVVGCYLLAPVVSPSDAAVATKSAPGRAMAGVAMSPVRMPSLTPQSLRLTESLYVAPSLTDANRAAERVAPRETRVVYVGHVSSANGDAPIKWIPVSPTAVSVSLPDGRSILVRVASDSTANSIGMGRVEFNGKRTSCP